MHTHLVACVWGVALNFKPPKFETPRLPFGIEFNSITIDLAFIWVSPQQFFINNSFSYYQQKKGYQELRLCIRSSHWWDIVVFRVKVIINNTHKTVNRIYVWLNFSNVCTSFAGKSMLEVRVWRKCLFFFQNHPLMDQITCKLVALLCK